MGTMDILHRWIHQIMTECTHLSLHITFTSIFQAFIVSQNICLQLRDSRLLLYFLPIWAFKVPVRFHLFKLVTQLELTLLHKFSKKSYLRIALHAETKLSNNHATSWSIYHQGEKSTAWCIQQTYHSELRIEGNIRGQNQSKGNPYCSSQTPISQGTDLFPSQTISFWLKLWHEDGNR